VIEERTRRYEKTRTEKGKIHKEMSQAFLHVVMNVVCSTTVLPSQLLHHETTLPLRVA
jgi:hypothetical protein